jgi:hypothetical protein
MQPARDWYKRCGYTHNYGSTKSFGKTTTLPTSWELPAFAVRAEHSHFTTQASCPSLAEVQRRQGSRCTQTELIHAHQLMSRRQVSRCTQTELIHGGQLMSNLSPATYLFIWNGTQHNLKFCKRCIGPYSETIAQPTFRRSMSPMSSVLKSKRSKNPAWSR